MRREQLNLPEPPTGDRPSSRYKCGRLGECGACVHGPSTGGSCPFDVSGDAASACKPTLTWTGKRRRFVTLVAACLFMAMACTGVLLDATWWAKPGELTSVHAQLLGDAMSSEPACAACHEAASRDPVGFLTAGRAAHDGAAHDGAAHGLVSRDGADLSSRCMECHHTTIPRERAAMAHNLSPRTRRELTVALIKHAGGAHASAWVPPAVDQESIACSVCHHEHRGKDADLSYITDAQCQSCHTNQFGRFAVSHPPFSRYPGPSESSIAFDHDSHYRKHFPKTDATLPPHQATAARDCRVCHVVDATGDMTARVVYESCRECHEAPIQVATTAVDWFSLPTIPDEAFDAPAGSVWPAAATGWFDGRLSPFVQLMLRADGVDLSTQNAIRNGDLSALNADESADLKIARNIASALTVFLRDIANEGQPAIARRFAKLGIDAVVTDRLFADLPPQLIDSATMVWFANATPTSERFDAMQKLIRGGWYRDDVTLALSYRGRGHEDDVVRAMVELAASLPVGDDVGDQLRSTVAVVTCTSCHENAATALTSWTSTDDEISEGRLTKFHHAPHLTSKQGGGCVDCHRLQSKVAAHVNLVGFEADAATRHSHGFADMNTSDCAGCHNAKSARDNCVTCHHYHAR